MEKGILKTIEGFLEMYSESKNEVIGKIYTTAELPHQKIKEITELIQKSVVKKVKLINEVDPSITGGIRIEVDSKV